MTKMHNKNETRQDYETPWFFIEAIENWMCDRFYYDLACTEQNKKAPVGFTIENPASIGSFAFNNKKLWSWCNPPFNNITPFAKICDEMAQIGHKTIMLTPLSRTEWFTNYCEKYQVMDLKSRFAFIGEKHGYNKDLIITIFDRTRMAKCRGLLDWHVYRT